MIMGSCCCGRSTRRRRRDIRSSSYFKRYTSSKAATVQSYHCQDPEFALSNISPVYSEYAFTVYTNPQYSAIYYETIGAEEPRPVEPEYMSSKNDIPDQLPVWGPSTPYCRASFDINNKVTTIEWKGYGLKIHILNDSIPHYLTLARLDVSVHVFENRESLPLSVGDHADPVSALYSIKVGTGKLCKPVTIEIQHCSSQHIKEAMILRAGRDGERFTPIKDAVFDHKYGKVTVPTESEFSEDQEYNDFSWFIIALRRVFFPYTIHYKAQVYISKENLKMHFIVTMAIDPCTTVVETKYDSDLTYELQADFAVEFDDISKRISLDIPLEGVALDSGWEITPLYNPSIIKRCVDRFCVFHNIIPKCEFSLHWSKHSPPTKLMHRINLKEGIANTKKHFFVSFDPPRDLSTSPANDHHNSVLKTTAGASISVSETAEYQVDGMLPGASDSTVQGTGMAVGVLSSGLPAELTAQHSGKNTTEYQTIRKCIPQLQTAFTHNLTEVSSHLLSKGVITTDQYRKLRNSEHSESDRAAKLVDFVMNKIELASKYYIRFVKALEEDKHTNEPLLNLLKETYNNPVSEY